MAEQEEPGDDDSEASDKAEATEDASEETKSSDETEASDESDAESEGGLDVGAEQGRLDQVGDQIAEARRGLEDLEEKTEPEPDGPPVASGEGAANDPPG